VVRLFNNFLLLLDINLEDLENMDKGVLEERFAWRLFKAVAKEQFAWVLAKEVLEVVEKNAMRFKEDQGKKEDKEVLEELYNQGDCWDLFRCPCLLCLVG